MEFIGPSWLAFAGLAIGGLVGFAVRRARLCTFGALEDAFVGADTRRLRVFGLAAAVAIAGTQALVLAGLLDPAQTTYVSVAVPWLGVAVGGVLFGFGMALVGTCAFGSLVRLGGGDLRSLVVILIFGLAAYATLRGVLAPFRIGVIETFAFAPPPPGRADIPGLVEGALGVDLRIWIAIALSGGLLLPAVTDRRLRRTPRLVLGGVALGLGVVAGWLATRLLADEFVQPIAPQSLTFVSPVARALFGVLFDRDTLLEFGVGSVVGAAGGAALAAIRAREFRWEAFDDPREMKRHLGGALLMGVGGVMCGGCTIGQGLTAGSMLALSWPLALTGIALGARLGIAVLMEGSVVQLLRSMRSPGPEAARSRNTSEADRKSGRVDSTAHNAQP
ncbi:YeeE/YedE family protein [Hansschlegelia sp. KR7-227]|uniref:YeeE/YedE family protein n=1 Tax=Hansschlegelia sp. KR7-227 TaxID=3400914 RepID=UPI003C02E2EE